MMPQPIGRPTIKDVARKAGVSLGTASRVINGHDSVNGSMRARVEQAVLDLGYRPDAVAQSMRFGSTRTIGIIVRDITVPVLAGFVKAAQDTLSEAGYTLLIAGSEDRRERELELLNVLSRRRVDGLIMTTASEHDAGLRKAREGLAFPIVLFDRETPASLDAVLVGHREGARQAVSYLLELGHRRIALLTGTQTVWPAVERVAGYREAFRARGLAPEPELVRGTSFTADAGYFETSALLSQERPPSAIIAGGIAMLPGTLRAVRAHGLRVPEDISIIGSSDSDLAELATPPVTVVQWDYAEIGKAAAQLVLDRIAGDPGRAPRRVRFPVELVIRASCAPPARPH